MLPCCTSGRASPTSPTHLLLFARSSVSCLTLVFGGGRVRCGDFGEDGVGASLVLKVESAVGGAGGILDGPIAALGAMWVALPLMDLLQHLRNQASRKNDLCWQKLKKK